MPGLIGQMRRAKRSENRVMPENLLDLDEVDAGLDQVSGIGMAQAMGGKLFFRPRDSTTARSAF